MQRRPLFIMSTPYTKTHRRNDIIFDVYKENSLKMYTRLIRGKGSRRKVTSQCKMPKNWPNFLQNEDNKKELCPFLDDRLKEADPQNLVFLSKEDGAIGLTNVDACSHLTMNLSCNHEEAGTRLIVHVHRAIKHSAIKTVAVLSNDVDIVVIAVAVFADLQQDGLQKLWVAFGQSNKRRWMPIHTLFEKLGKEKSRALLFFLAFSDCDNVSGFKGKGKKMLFQTWSSTQHRLL